MAKEPIPKTIGDARRLLRLYNEKAEALRNGSFRHKVFVEDHGFVLNLAAGQPVHVEKRGADEEAIFAMALTLRLLIQTRDGFSVHQIADLYERLPVPDADKQNTRLASKDFDEFLDAPMTPMALKFDQEIVTNRRFFETIMYGGIAHANVNQHHEYEHFIKPILPVMMTIWEEIVATLLDIIWWFVEPNKRTLAQLEGMKDSDLLPA